MDQRTTAWMEDTKQPATYSQKTPQDRGDPDECETKSSDPMSQCVKHFIANSSAHGFKMIFEKQIGIFRRGLWTLYFLFALGALLYFLYDSYRDITRYPFKTVTSINMTSSLRFPAVTVCSTNPLDLSNIPPDRAQMLETWLGNDFGSIGKSSSSGVDHAGNESTFDVGQWDVADVQSATAVGIEDFFSQCVYDEKNLNCSELFSPFCMTFDRCYMLDPTRLPLATRRTSLRLTVFTNQAGYSSTVHTAGVKFQVHFPEESPDTMTSTHVASPGFHTNVAIRVSEYQYLAPPYKAFGDAECVDTMSEDFRRQMDGDPELFPGSSGKQYYSLDACIVARASELTIEKCNCTIGLKALSYPRCTMGELTGCFVDHIVWLLDQAFATNLLGCPRACHYFRFHTTISASYFPSPQAEHWLRQSGVFRQNVSDIRQNYLQLNFHYEDLVIHKTTQVPEYEANSIMGLLGGNMGFFLGASVLTLVELVDLFMCLCLTAVTRLWFRRTAAVTLSKPGKKDGVWSTSTDTDHGAIDLDKEKYHAEHLKGRKNLSPFPTDPLKTNKQTNT